MLQRACSEVLLSAPFIGEGLFASVSATARRAKAGMGKAAGRGKAVGSMWGVSAPPYVAGGHVEKCWDTMLECRV